MSSVCAAWLARGEKRLRRGSCATKSNLGGREALARWWCCCRAAKQMYCKRACTGLDWTGLDRTVRGHDRVLCSALLCSALLFSALTRARQTGRWYWRQSKGGVEEEVAARWLSSSSRSRVGYRWSSGGGREGGPGGATNSTSHFECRCSGLALDGRLD